jgi:hypothetical protein
VVIVSNLWLLFMVSNLCSLFIQFIYLCSLVMTNIYIFLRKYPRKQGKRWPRLTNTYIGTFIFLIPPLNIRESSSFNPFHKSRCNCEVDKLNGSTITFKKVKVKTLHLCKEIERFVFQISHFLMLSHQCEPTLHMIILR